MALTMAQAATLTNSMLLQGVVETIVNQSAVLKRLPFMDVIGSALAYPQETALANAAFNTVGGTWTESTPSFAQQQEPLKILGGDADVDNFLKRTYAATNDIEAVILEEKAKAVAYTFSNYFFNGNPGGIAGVPGGLGGDPNSFAGLHARMIGIGQNLVAGTNGATLALGLMDQLIDSVKPGVPDVLYMSRRTRRQLNALRRATGSLLQTSYDQFGQFIMTYDGIPVEVDDFIRDDCTVGTSGNVCSTIYAVQHGFETGLMGLQNGMLQVDHFAALETKDATRNRLKWYVGMTIFRPIACAMLTGITYP